MKKIKLNGWQWIWILLSIVWALSVGIHMHNGDIKTANFFADLNYKNCTNENLLAAGSNPSRCDQEREKSFAQWLEMGNSNSNAVFSALLTIPLTWLAVFILTYITRAQVIGFRAVIPWPTLNWRKKFFVIFCALAVLLISLSSIITILNLYVDTEVPVSLYPFTDKIEDRGGFVTVTGTWTRTDLTDDTIMNPLQTSKIECNQQEHKCREANASVSGNVLTADLKEYDIKSWTPDAVVFQDEEGCSITVFTIDLNTQTVSGAGHLINQDSTICKMNLKSKENWSFLLVNGFKVYWEQRQKARPAPLKIIQAFFGK